MATERSANALSLCLIQQATVILALVMVSAGAMNGATSLLLPLAIHVVPLNTPAFTDCDATTKRWRQAIATVNSEFECGTSLVTVRLFAFPVTVLVNVSIFQCATHAAVGESAATHRGNRNSPR